MTTVRLALPEARTVSAHVYDIRGRRVATLANTTLNAGEHVLEWNGRSTDGRMAGAGVYLLRIIAGENTEVRRITRIR